MSRPTTVTPEQRQAYENQWHKDHIKSLTGYKLLEPYLGLPTGTFLRRYAPTGEYYTMDAPTVRYLIPRNLLKNFAKLGVRKERYDELCKQYGFNL